MNNGRVLCVENHKEYLGVLKYMLETAGYEVVSATTGGQGLSILTKQPIQGVPLEYDLPANVGKDYAGFSCTGKEISVTSQTLTPRGIGEDYHGFEGAPPTGSRVTIGFSLVMVPAASSLSEGRKSGGGGRVRRG